MGTGNKPLTERELRQPVQEVEMVAILVLLLLVVIVVAVHVGLHVAWARRVAAEAATFRVESSRDAAVLEERIKSSNALREAEAAARVGWAVMPGHVPVLYVVQSTDVLRLLTERAEQFVTEYNAYASEKLAYAYVVDPDLFTDDPAKWLGSWEVTVLPAEVIHGKSYRSRAVVSKQDYGRFAKVVSAYDI